MSKFVLPNVRKLFIPDKGYTMFEADLSGADGQVVAWEADDAEIKHDLSAKVDMHVKNALQLGDEDLSKLDSKSHLYYTIRQNYKRAVHLTNYGGSAKVLSMTTGWPLGKCQSIQQRYFARHPGVYEWHKRTQHELATKRTASNRFGYRIIYFDRIDNLLPQALAWVPQSTVALTCFRGALALRRALPYAQILLQVHDSVVFQVPHRHAEDGAIFVHHLSNPVPYPDPLIIPWGLSRSDKSWGHCEKVKL